MTLSSFISNNNGKLLCPSCKAKLGSWNWLGVKYVVYGNILGGSRTERLTSSCAVIQMQLQTFRHPSISVGSQ